MKRHKKIAFVGVLIPPKAIFYFALQKSDRIEIIAFPIKTQEAAE
jgi:hypothetical protein